MSDDEITVDTWVVDQATGDSGLVMYLREREAFVSFGRKSRLDEWIPLDDLELAVDEFPSERTS